MELHLSPLRLAILAVLLLGFGLMGGFLPPEPAIIDASPRHVHRAWIYCVLLFVGGAISATVINHFVGTVDRTSLRFAYILGGVLAMIAGGFWLHILKQAVATP